MAVYEMADILEALLLRSCPEDPTFQRMVRWYRDVADELECRAEYERLLAWLLAPWETAARVA